MLLELLLAGVEKLGDSNQAAVDLKANWHNQIRQEVKTYVGYIESTKVMIGVN
ncbi:hypothetical protein [Mycobacterium lepromatosis]|uniref:hypothetical protein n=1 Tax=Mycobacterium lepromatosis TaxID=480418 RepID=UPI000B1B15F7|nr:hypothetical protein [Mycobacterium lepromatosis]